MYEIKVKLATIVKGDQKVPFSIASTQRCRGGRYSFPWIAPLYPWYVPYIAECLTRRYQVPFLKSLVWHNQGLNLGLLDHWQTLYPLGQWANLFISTLFFQIFQPKSVYYTQKLYNWFFFSHMPFHIQDWMAKSKEYLQSKLMSFTPL